jgi:hypothetical protein
MRNEQVIQRMFIVASLALIPWSPVLAAQAAEQSHGEGIPEVMTEQSSTMHWDAPAANAARVKTAWVEDIRSSLAMYKKSYPTSNFDPYLKKLDRAEAAVGRGDRTNVKGEMGGFFKMLATRAHGISDVAANELTNLAQMAAPIEEYGITVPRSGSSQYGSEVPR